MSRDELKEIIRRVIVRMQQEEPPHSPLPGCTFNDNCDATTLYAVGEEG